MRVTAKVDYAVRAAVELARVGASSSAPAKGDRVAEEQAIPLKYLENILGSLRRAGIVASQRGAEGGYWLARPPAEITVADIIRAVEGPLADVRGERPERVEYPPATAVLQPMWIAVRANLRDVLDAVTVADLEAGALPPHVQALADRPDAWDPR
ncbi:MAG: Rrf2 family transcriptional regulator [Acidimicrobiales bacterium]